MKYVLLFVTVATIAGGVAQAQQLPQAPGPEPEHEWLKQFVGEWTTSSKSAGGEGVPAMECSGTMKSRMLGGLWVVNELTSEVGETTIHALQTIGYDPEKKKYVGTWVDSMMNHLWQYEGEVDESGKKLMLIAKGPNLAGGNALTTYRDSYEIKSPDLIVATSEVADEDGNWMVFMTGELKRVKK